MADRCRDSDLRRFTTAATKARFFVVVGSHIEGACVLEVFSDIQDGKSWDPSAGAGDHDSGIRGAISRGIAEVCAIAINRGCVEEMILHHSLFHRHFAGDFPNLIGTLGPFDDNETRRCSGVGVPGNPDRVATRHLGGKVLGRQQIRRERAVHDNPQFGLTRQSLVIGGDDSELKFACRQIRPGAIQRDAGDGDPGPAVAEQ